MTFAFPVLPDVPGLPPLPSFPGVASVTASIQGNIATFTSGTGAVAQGLALIGPGVAAGTVLTSGLQSITNGIGTASINISQTIASAIPMQLTGSLSGLLPDVGSLLGGDSVSAIVAGAAAAWGIYLDNALVLTPDSFVSLEYKKDWHIADYPIEDGKFVSYNKVRVPYEARVMMTKSGTKAEVSDFLETLETIADSLDLYAIVTPEKTYDNANVTHFDYRRTSDNGAQMVTAQVWFQEVRLEASSEFTQVAEPSGAAQINVGAVQAQVTAVVQEKIVNATRGVTGSW